MVPVSSLLVAGRGVLGESVTSEAMAAALGKATVFPLGLGRGRRLGRGLALPPARLAGSGPTCDVVVSGGGMVGSAMAAALGKGRGPGGWCGVQRLGLSGRGKELPRAESPSPPRAPGAELGAIRVRQTRVLDTQRCGLCTGV